MKNVLRILSLGALGASLLSSAYAAGGAAAGLTLLQLTSPRSASVGEAFTAAHDDIGAFSFNPGSLPSMRLAQASFLFQRGRFDDSYGQLMIGRPTAHGALGLSVGYYSSGAVELFDGNQSQTVIGQRDTAMALGYGLRLGRFSVGTTAKYLRSELAGTASATAVAADAGLQWNAARHLRIGAALQNVGTALKFADEGDPLPRLFRLGLSWNTGSTARGAEFFSDAAYALQTHSLVPAAGAEVRFGPLALRGGYRKEDTSILSIGAGIAVGRFNLDYAFGFQNALDSTHKIGLSTTFGGTPDARAGLTARPNDNSRRTL